MNYQISVSDIEMQQLCPVCGTEGHVPVAEVIVGDLLFFTTSYCAQCFFVFRSVRPKISWFQQNWIKRKIITDKNKYSFTSPLEQRRYKRYKNLSSVFEKISEKRTILDIGTGPGTGLKAFKDSQWDVTGYEPDPSRAEIAVQQHGIRMLEKLEESSETYDFVTIIQTLEHIHQPYDFLNSISPLIKTGGYIYIEVPDLFNFVNWRDALYLEHMNNFTIKTLILLCLRLNMVLRYQLFPKTTPYGSTHIGALFEKVEHNPDRDILSDDISKDICSLYVKGLPISRPVFPIKYQISEINNIAITTTDDYPVLDKKNQCIIMRQSRNIIEKSKLITFKLKSTNNFINFILKRLALHFPNIFKDHDFEKLKFINIDLQQPERVM